MSRARRRAALVLAALAALTAAGLPAAQADQSAQAGPTAPASPTAQASEPAVEVAITGIDPMVLQPGQDLTVTVRLTNDGPVVAQPRVLVTIDRSAFISRSSLDRWRTADPDADLGTTVATVDLDAPLTPGASRTVTVTVPAGDVGLLTGPWRWGPRGLGATVVDVADPTRVRLGVARSFVVWFPEQEVTATRLSVLVPVTGPAPAVGVTAPANEATEPGGRLDALLAATAEHREVTWALDPWIAALATGDTDPTGPTDRGDGALGGLYGWGDRLLAASDGREVALLPWADADVTALVHTGSADLLAEATERSRRVAEALGLTSGLDLVLPAEDLPDLPTAAEAARGERALTVGPGQLAAPSVMTYTPTGRADVETAAGTAAVLVPDARISAALSGDTVLADGTVLTHPPTTAAAAAADLLAELAVITRERPSQARHLLALLPRDWSADPERFDAQLDALADAPWVELAPVADLVAEPATVQRGTLPERRIDRTEVSGVQLAQVRAAVEQRESLASTVADPDRVLGDVEHELIAPASTSWRDDPAGRTTLVAASTALTEELIGSVYVPQAETVNLVSPSGELPLRVANDLDQDVTLVVRLVPENSRLVAERAVEVVVPAGGEASVTVPVHGVQSDDVQTTVELRTADGRLLDDSTTLVVRVRAEWESIGTAIAGGLLGVALVIGLVRTIRRGRGRGRVEDPVEPAAVPG